MTIPLYTHKLCNYLIHNIHYRYLAICRSDEKLKKLEWWRYDVVKKCSNMSNYLTGITSLKDGQTERPR